MNLDDFERCTPAEFSSIFDVWAESRVQADRREWEHTRMMCLCALQPYSKKTLKPSDVMQFPWEKEETPREELTREELWARFEEAKQRYGLT